MLNRRLTHSAALAFTFAAIAAPTAAAQQDMRNPDNRPSPADPGQTQDFRGPDTRDHAEGRGTHNAPDVMVIRVPGAEVEAAPAGGIDWGDAGIGAGAALGLTLIVAGGALLAVHRKQSATLGLHA
jgi:hypothetical protein